MTRSSLRPRGWLTLWIMLVVVGIFSTFGPAPGSVEGLIYTTLPVGGQLGGLIEVLAQALLLAVVLFYWVNHPEKRWLSWTLGGFFRARAHLLRVGLLPGLRGSISPSRPATVLRTIPAIPP
ncbi:MAG: hypothetical protein R2851_01760 [Caldilineaceae bacterium]